MKEIFLDINIFIDFSEEIREDNQKSQATLFS